ncbi:hypothetical protein PF010_g21851 [Phytophthora fragariae]|uniref:Secreted protein n=1 Tax=Phytophthora fragariae TaxID=53985 RepID=A0A6A3QMG5_9STRA|nr:hypothetical protein PF003_g11304 [Phytophthora fragariae]KAE8925897.1 hypothetical protein PF009_g23900 [Phytophthora fragariae]KAE9078683.1 hypothetical protein PF007_g23751 [Phytophthora fragariae]KAE9081785.1 hypothetical protein PF010_g21851 [Phytophthora fragariae]KAE9105544.1 hypothetical protein PF006_g21620 [Phytophthora fragariae]
MTPACSIFVTLSSIIASSACACRRCFSMIGFSFPVSIWCSTSSAVTGGQVLVSSDTLR